MIRDENIQIVKRHFEAFGRGDLQSALEPFADTVDFLSPVTRNAPPEMSWAKSRRSKREIEDFFKEMAEKTQVEGMETVEFIADEDHVVVEGKNRGIARSTGNKYEHDWVMVFTMKEGKVVRAWHYYDTADVMAAFHD